MDILDKKIVDPDKFGKDLEKAQTGLQAGIQGENSLCYMLTPEQLNAEKDQSPHMIIEGDYGTGKTFVLKEKTKSCAKKNPNPSKIAYINLTLDTQDSHKYEKLVMMDTFAKSAFKDLDNVDVVTAKDLKQHYMEHKREIDEMNKEKYLPIEFSSVIGNIDICFILRSFLCKKQYDHVFIDEMPIVVSLFNEPIDIFYKNKPFCITIKSDKLVAMDEIKNKDTWNKFMEEKYSVRRIRLNYNKRNPVIIENLAASLQDDFKETSLIPTKNITGAFCYCYHNIHQLNNDVLARAAINRYFLHKPRHVIVIYKDITSSIIPCNIYLDLQQKFGSNRNVVFLPQRLDYYQNFKKDDVDYDSYKRDIEAYIEQKEGILVTNIDTFQGAQARNTVILAGENSNTVIRNMILRTMAFAVVIHDKELDLTVPGVVKVDDLHDYIHTGIQKPVCYFYKHINGLDVNKLSISILKKVFSSNQQDSFLIMTFDSEQALAMVHNLQEELERKIVCQPSLNTYENEDKEKYFEDFKRSLERPQTILFANLLDVSKELYFQPDSLIQNMRTLLWNVKNIVIYPEQVKEARDEEKKKQERENELRERKKMNRKKRWRKRERKKKEDWDLRMDETKQCMNRDFILSTNCCTIVTHDGNVELFKPVTEVKEIIDLHEYLLDDGKDDLNDSVDKYFFSVILGVSIGLCSILIIKAGFY